LDPFYLLKKEAPEYCHLVMGVRYDELQSLMLQNALEPGGMHVKYETFEYVGNIKMQSDQTISPSREGLMFE
jgi:hypothetical protein